MEIINLTPHPVSACGHNFPVSGNVARVSSKEIEVGPMDNTNPPIMIVKQVFGEVEGLPEPREGVVYIVSRLVAMEALKNSNRNDLYVPARLQRDESGNIIGANALETLMELPYPFMVE